MSISLHKTIRPTKLQPQLFTLVNKLSRQPDYRIIIDKDNNPLCALVSFALIKDFDFEKTKSHKMADLEKEMKSYYKNMSKDEFELLNEGLDHAEM